MTGPAARVSRRLPEAWDVLVGTDPGLLRLRLAVRAALAVALVVGAENLVAPRVGMPTVVAVLLGGMVAMNGSFAASSLRRGGAAVTLAFFPVAAACGVLPACLVAGHRLAGLVVFVAVMVAAVFARRYGPRGFQYGMIAWLAYFFAMFVGFRLGDFWNVMAVVAAAGGCVLISAVLLVPDRPAAAYTSSRRAFDLRVAALAEAARDALSGGPPPDRIRRQLQARGFRVVEAALIIDGRLSQAAAAGGRGERAVGIRHALLDVELAAEELAATAVELSAVQGLPDGVRGDLRAALAAVATSDPGGARAHVAALARWLATAPEEVPAAVSRLVRDAVRALQQLLDALEVCRDAMPGGPVPEAPAHVERFTPAVQLFLGNLPSTSPTAVAAVEAVGGSSWWSRRSLNTRLCLQVAVAASLAVAAGDLLSGRRYYWAVLACFLVLTGTFTTGEIAVKGANRVLGTVAGLIVAAVTVHLTGSHEAAIVAVVLVCVFLGLYFFRVSYAVMAFAITTVMGQLYNVLHEFSDRLLLLRLAETALGAAIGIAVALVLMPVRTADVLAVGVDAFLTDVRALLEEVRQRLASGVPAGDLFLATRRIDGRLHQVAQLALPASGQTLVGLSGRRASRRLTVFTETAYRARALAAAVAEASRRPAPGATPGAESGRALAADAGRLLERLEGVRAGDGIERVGAVLTETGEGMRVLRRQVERAARVGGQAGAPAAGQL